jgi:preprotein translocase subunit YajC
MGPFLLLAGTFLLMWVLFILPQQRRMRSHRELVGSLEVGDDVMTTAGMYGTITAIDEDDDVVHLEIAPGTVVRFARGAVAQRLGVEEEPAVPPARPSGTAADRAVEPVDPPAEER